MYSFFVVKVTYYDEISHNEDTNYCLYAGDSFSNVTGQILNDWGKDNVISISMTEIGDGAGESLIISESLADALEHDLSDEIICIPSNWRKQKEKNKQ